MRAVRERARERERDALFPDPRMSASSAPALAEDFSSATAAAPSVAPSVEAAGSPVTHTHTHTHTHTRTLRDERERERECVRACVSSDTKLSAGSLMLYVRGSDVGTETDEGGGRGGGYPLS